MQSQRTEMDKLIEALLYSFVIYVTFSALFGSLQIRTADLLELSAIAVAWAILVSIMWTNDVIGKVLRPLRITQSTSRRSVWINTFHEYSGYVLVELDAGRLVLGWVGYYSDGMPASLFLEQAAWVTPDGERHHIDGPGILITETSGIKTISFLAGIDIRHSAVRGKKKSP